MLHISLYMWLILYLFSNLSLFYSSLFIKFNFMRHPHCVNRSQVYILEKSHTTMNILTNTGVVCH
jgi:hypothetical protein